ncbi:MAG: DNA polymerase II large subunit [Candidatus Micrarchaeia archaeon]
MIEEYFEALQKGFEKEFEIASAARSLGYDPKPFVEIKPAPDLASRVEGIIGLHGLAEMIKSKASGKTRQELAFEITGEICKRSDFGPSDLEKKLTLAVRVGLSVLTEGVLVAPTEGVQGVKIHKSAEGSDYIAVLYAGPIRGAGGTSAALSVVLADYARRILGIGAYKPSQTEVARYVEEVLMYHSIAHLQYLPSEEDMRVALENCPVCIDGVPTEDAEVSVHRNLKRLDANGKEELVTNRVRGGVALVLCEGIMQKAKSVLKYAKAAGLDWDWLNRVIKVDKNPTQSDSEKEKAVFLQEIVAGRPILAYPAHYGSFRLRYGRSRFTGIASKGFSPATMVVLEDFIAPGTQLKVEKPGKGCIAMPVDSIEGPFVKLSTGEAFRVNSAEKAREIKPRISKILSVGDMLVTYGDFKKTNTLLQPTSYVEEYWYEQLKAAGYAGAMPEPSSFMEAFELSMKYSVPMHPLYTYEFQDVEAQDLLKLCEAISRAEIIESEGEKPMHIAELKLGEPSPEARETLERLCVPHFDSGAYISIKGGDAASLALSLGFYSGSAEALRFDRSSKILESKEANTLALVNSVSMFKVMRRSTRLGARIGRPEKAKERLMKPAPNVLFPIGEYGGKERNISKAYSNSARSFGSKSIEVEIARYRCSVGGESLYSRYCRKHNAPAIIERVCKSCGRRASEDDAKCVACGGELTGFESKNISLSEAMESAMQTLGISTPPQSLKGVKGLFSKNKEAEPLEKGILRSMHGIYIFKDGTARFDATDAPITHFYPEEIGVSVEKLKSLGYSSDAYGAELESGSQLVELKHQDVILNRRGAEYLLKVSNFLDDLLEKFYGQKRFYNAKSIDDLVGKLVVTLSPHTSSGVLGRIIGFTDSSIGLAHPYLVSARRRNCDGDEDTTMLLLDALVNFSREYLATSVGGTMDAPIILTVNVSPEEVDDEVHAMEVVGAYGLDFYEKSLAYASPGEVKLELVGSRLGTPSVFSGLNFTHGSSSSALKSSPARSAYTKLNNMEDKVRVEFMLMDKLNSVDKRDAAKRLIISHFIPDLIGNLHSFSKQSFRCISCNAKYRRVPLSGVCEKCGGKLVLTISKGGIIKYLDMARGIADRYNLDTYLKQTLELVKKEIETVFGGGVDSETKQINLAKFM